MTRILVFRLLLLTLCVAGRGVSAEPYLAVQQGYKCNVCHVNPTGGGLRNNYGVIFAQNILPVDTLNLAQPSWNGKLSDFIRLGGDLRASVSRNTVPNTRSRQQFALDQVRIYADVTIIADRLGVYLDEQLAPNAAVSMEAYLSYGDPANGWYVKGGKFYLPFGWRLQDQTAFVREVTGIGMATPDNGIELGLERPNWSTQVAVTNGAANAQSGSGHQITGQVIYIQPRWRFGTALSSTQSVAGNRGVIGMFAGLRTGPIAWLGEIDLIKDEGYPAGARRFSGALAEANWNLARGQNLKLTGEYLDPDRAVSHDQQTRWSILYELTPFPFVQLRAGFRRYRGIPQNDLQNRRLLFFELHGYF